MTQENRTVKTKVVQEGQITAESVNTRVDNMVVSFNELRSELRRVTGVLTTLMQSELNTVDEMFITMREMEASLIAGVTKEQDAQIKLAEAKSSLAAVDESMSDFESELFLNVCAELNEDNKPLYTNDTQRKNALQLAKASGQGDAAKAYRSAAKVARSHETEIMRVAAELDAVRNQHKVDRTVHAGLVARLQNMTARVKFVGE